MITGFDKKTTEVKVSRFDAYSSVFAARDDRVREESEAWNRYNVAVGDTEKMGALHDVRKLMNGTRDYVKAAQLIINDDYEFAYVMVERMAVLLSAVPVEDRNHDAGDLWAAVDAFKKGIASKKNGKVYGAMSFKSMRDYNRIADGIPFHADIVADYVTDTAATRKNFLSACRSVIMARMGAKK